MNGPARPVMSVYGARGPSLNQPGTENAEVQTPRCPQLALSAA